MILLILHIDTFILKIKASWYWYSSSRPTWKTSFMTKNKHPKDLTGKVFGRLLVLRECKETGYTYKWLCRCECGTEKAVLRNSLVQGKTKSCGCMRKDLHTIHGKSLHPLYSTWEGMNSRCNNPKDMAYRYYGGRGITVCDEWRDFATFLEDMGDKPSGLHTIERVDLNIGYCKENCIWETRTRQQRNKAMGCNNTSGVTGVHFSNGYWCATWIDLEGMSHTRNFSVRKYGDNGAFEMAVSFRNEVIIAMNALGAGYTDNHGKPYKLESNK